MWAGKVASQGKEVLAGMFACAASQATVAELLG